MATGLPLYLVEVAFSTPYAYFAQRCNNLLEQTGGIAERGAQHGTRGALFLGICKLGVYVTLAKS